MTSSHVTLTPASRNQWERAVVCVTLWNERETVVSEQCHTSLARGQTLGTVCHLVALLSVAGGSASSALHRSSFEFKRCLNGIRISFFGKHPYCKAVQTPQIHKAMKCTVFMWSVHTATATCAPATAGTPRDPQAGARLSAGDSSSHTLSPPHEEQPQGRGV